MVQIIEVDSFSTSPVNNRTDLVSLSSTPDTEFHERPMSANPVENIKRTDPDGVSSSLSERTKLHLSRAKKLVGAGRPFSPTDEPTVSLSYTTSESLGNSSGGGEMKRRSMSIYARKNSLVKRFEERDNTRMNESLTPYLTKERTSAPKDENTPELSPQKREKTPESKMVQVKPSEDETEASDLKSMQWDTKTVIQEQKRIRGILESRLGSGYLNRPKEVDVNRNSERTIFFKPLTPTKSPSITTRSIAEETSLGHANTVEEEAWDGETETYTVDEEHREEDFVEESASEEEYENEDVKSAAEIEDECSETSGTSGYASTSSETSRKISHTESDVDNSIQSMQSTQRTPTVTHVHNKVTSPNDESTKGAKSIDSDRLRLAATRLRPVFDELRVLSTRTAASKDYFPESPVEHFPEPPAEIADPPASSFSTSEKHSRSLAIQQSLSTYDFSNGDKYAATQDEEKSTAESQVSTYEKEDQSTDNCFVSNNLPKEEDIYVEASDNKSRASIGHYPVLLESTTPIQENKGVGGKAFDFKIPKLEIEQIREVESKGTDLDSIAEMVIHEEVFKKKLRSTARSPPPPPPPPPAKIENSLSFSADSYNLPQGISAMTSSFADDSCSYVSGSTGLSSRHSRISKRVSRSRSVPRSVSSRRSKDPEEIRQNPPTRVPRPARSMSPARSRSSRNSETSRSHVFRRFDSFDNVLDTNPKKIPQVKPPSQRSTVNMPPRPKTAVSGSTRSDMRGWYKEKGHESVSRTDSNAFSKPTLSYDSAGLNTLENESQDDKSLSVPSDVTSFDECRDPPEGNDPPGKIRVNTKKTKPSFFRNMSRQLSRQISRPLSRQTKQSTIREHETFEDPPKQRPTRRSHSRTIEHNDDDLASLRIKPERGEDDDLASLRVKPLRATPLATTTQEDDDLASLRVKPVRATQKANNDHLPLPRSKHAKPPQRRINDDLASLRQKPVRAEKQPPPVRRPSIPQYRHRIESLSSASTDTTDLIERSRSIEARDPSEKDESIEKPSSRSPRQLASQSARRPMERLEESKPFNEIEPPRTIFEPEHSMDSSILSSTIETLEAENRDLKRQLASMMELLEETDASVAYLQEALKKGDSPDVKVRSRRYGRRSSSYRRGHRIIQHTAE